MNEWKSAAELVDLLAEAGIHVKQDTLRHWAVLYDDFPAGRKIGRAWVWKPKEVIAWCKRTGRPRPSPIKTDQ